MSSLSIFSGSHHSGASAINSCHQWSLPAFICAPVSSPIRFKTTACSMDGVSVIASSALRLSGTTVPRR